MFNPYTTPSVKPHTHTKLSPDYLQLRREKNTGWAMRNPASTDYVYSVVQTALPTNDNAIMEHEKSGLLFVT